jgi:dUTP pyrophosphatase
MDLHAAVRDSILVNPNEIALIPCGFAIAVPQGFEAQIRPRSGISTKKGITVVNTPGTIDPDYRGEVKVGIINLGPQRFEITRGMRIAQLVVAPVLKVCWQVVDELPPTARSGGGFGHTGS